MAKWVGILLETLKYVIIVIGLYYGKQVTVQVADMQKKVDTFVASPAGALPAPEKK